MALIKCPNCGKQYSEYASKCPTCGLTLNEAQEAHAKKKEKTKHSLIIGGKVAALALVVIALVLLIIHGISSQRRKELPDFPTGPVKVYEETENPKQPTEPVVVSAKTENPKQPTEPVAVSAKTENPKQPRQPKGIPDAIELGLAVKWASHNVGAKTPEGYGDYFAWGEIKPKNDYSWKTYKWYESGSNTLTKYNTNSSLGIVDNKRVLEPGDDVASVEYGNDWRMPTHKEFQELKTRCSWEYTSRNGHKGYLITGPNGNSIFLPAGGNSVGYSEHYGCYWCSDLGTKTNEDGYNFDFTSSFTDINSDWRYLGRCVRAVQPK